ncbi:MAG: sigma-70 family RNA polymerase sigma factor [Gammaproteobacteria bacterium]|nr:sigma-70 family RNA polymerase sigma factor [Gammaproteobacteria bacterium]
MSESATADLGECSERELWRLALEQAEESARLQLIDHYLELAHKIAAKLFLRRPDDSVEFGDYYQYAVVGLIESVDRYRPDAGTVFSTYASYRIRGAVLNGVSSASESREQIAFRSRMRKQRVESLAQPESGGAEGLFAQMAELTTGLAIGYMLEDSGLAQEPGDKADDEPSSQYGIGQVSNQLLEVIDALPRRDKLIISYHYFQHISFEEIARILNVTKGRVSQIHKRILRQFRERLADCIEMDSYF